MKLIRGSDILAIGDAMRSLEDLAEGGDRASWKARALAAESKLARLEGLERAAREAAGWFREYENLHAAKGTADGDRKALLNADRAERIEAALAYASEKE